MPARIHPICPALAFDSSFPGHPHYTNNKYPNRGLMNQERTGAQSQSSYFAFITPSANPGETARNQRTPWDSVPSW